VSDEEMMQLIARRDEVAFRRLYDRHKETIAAHLWRQCGDPELTADAVSETFVRVWRRANSFCPGKGSFKAWILTVATNALRSLWRKQSSLGESVPENLPDTGGPTEDDRLAVLAMRSVWHDLSKEHREAVSLRFFSGLSYQEIARMQQVPIATARTRVFYALRRLKQLLEDPS
jgi:RNA polymerase sigma-70 factor (ECF subfamily)